MRIKVSFVVAAAENHVIGQDGDMPWKLPSDLKRFRKLTLDKPVIMGRKTFQSIGKPLDRRDNIILTRDRDFSASGAKVVHDVDEAIKIANDAAADRNAEEIAVIGGGQVYALFDDVVDIIYLTRVHVKPDGDTSWHYPTSENWEEVHQEGPMRQQGDSAETSFIILKKKQAD